MNFDVFTFPSLVSSCKKIRQLSLETAWKIMVPSFPKRPPEDCLQFVCQEAHRLNLPPMLIPPLSLNSCPDDFEVGALIANPLELVPTCSFEKLTSMTIYSCLHFLSSLISSSYDKNETTKVYEEAINGLIKREPKNLKSLMLKHMYISTETFRYLNLLAINELRLEDCYLILNNVGNFKSSFHLNLITKLYIGTTKSLTIDSSFMFKKLKELTIHQYCPNSSQPLNVRIEICATHFTSLEYL